jgi:hypothetical protein
MTLYALDQSHFNFIKNCRLHGGYTNDESESEARRVLEISMASDQAYYFVGPSYSSPRYFIGGFVDTRKIATLDVGHIGNLGPNIYRDATQWLDYILNVCGVRLIEANVWVADLKKEWLLRALGFSKGGVVPDKVEIPDLGFQPALLLFIRPIDFKKVNKTYFRETLKKFREHLLKLKAKRSREWAASQEATN